jgi:predicted nucleic acid-binding protein
VAVDGALTRLDLVVLTRDVLLAAGRLPDVALRSLDAIHVATALSIDADSFLTADRRQADAAEAVGLMVRRFLR